LNPTTALCDGCLRTVDEIARWGDAGDEERAIILAATVERRTTQDLGDGLARESEKN
jgi:hypothetical protein